MAAISANTAGRPSHQPNTPASTAAMMLPAWLNASLRPSWRSKPPAPTRPSVMPATAGASAAAAMPLTACATVTTPKLGASNIAMEAAITTAEPTTTMARFARLESTSAPIGMVATMPASPPRVITSPISPGVHCFCCRNTPRNGPSPSRTSERNRLRAESAAREEIAAMKGAPVADTHQTPDRPTVPYYLAADRIMPPARPSSYSSPRDRPSAAIHRRAG